MQDATRRRYLFAAIDRATRWVFVQIKAKKAKPKNKVNKTAVNIKALKNALHKACPIKITRLLADNGQQFTNRLFASREREPGGRHELDQLCKALGIEQRLTQPRTPRTENPEPRTDGMVERFNGRMADVLKTHRFNSAEDLCTGLGANAAALCGPLYKHQLPQSALQAKRRYRP